MSENISALITDRTIPYIITEYGSVTSTSTLAIEAAKQGAAEGYTVIADSQTEGRGRKVGRHFHSPAHTGLYMSIVLRPKGGYESFLGITSAAAVAVCRAISSQTDKRPLIKWVNDILIDGKKVCGILTEASFLSDGSGLEYAILGVGINICPPENGFPDGIKDIAGSVSDTYDATLKDRIAAAFLSEFSRIYGGEEYMDEYRHLSAVIGKNVSIYRTPTAEISENTPCDKAYAYGIDDDCRLMVRFPDGKEEVLFSGEISIR